MALNYTINAQLATELVKTFYEVILTPSIEKDALAILAQKKNLRVLEYDLPEKINTTSNVSTKTFLAQDENFTNDK